MFCDCTTDETEIIVHTQCCEPPGPGCANRRRAGEVEESEREEERRGEERCEERGEVEENEREEERGGEERGEGRGEGRGEVGENEREEERREEERGEQAPQVPGMMEESEGGKRMGGRRIVEVEVEERGGSPDIPVCHICCGSVCVDGRVWDITLCDCDKNRSCFVHISCYNEIGCPDEPI